MTFIGNKTLVLDNVQLMAFDALKDGFASHNINWNTKSCERAIKDFNELSLLVAETVLSNMEDVGDSIPYVQGRPTKQDIKRGSDLVRDYYDKQMHSSKYGEKKADMFKKSFESRIDKIAKEWKIQMLSFFKRKA